MRAPTRAALAGLVLGLAACSGGDAPVETAAARGEKIYSNVCITCHAADPSQEGTAGPAVAGASQALLEAKIVHGSYPPGYTPKRGSSLMPKLPHLKEYTADLAAYLLASQRGEAGS